jgi:hypothetical protein
MAKSKFEGLLQELDAVKELSAMGQGSWPLMIFFVRNITCWFDTISTNGSKDPLYGICLMRSPFHYGITSFDSTSLRTVVRFSVNRTHLLHRFIPSWLALAGAHSIATIFHGLDTTGPWTWDLKSYSFAYG